MAPNLQYPQYWDYISQSFDSKRVSFQNYRSFEIVLKLRLNLRRAEVEKVPQILLQNSLMFVECLFCLLTMAG